jgi:hypothetical protein
MALFGMGLVAGFFFSWPLSMSSRRLRGLLISLIFNFIIITFSPFFLLLFLLHYFFFTPFGIGGRRVTPSRSRAALRAFLPQGFLHGPKSGRSCLALVLRWVEGSSFPRLTFNLTIWIGKMIWK